MDGVRDLDHIDLHSLNKYIIVCQSIYFLPIKKYPPPLRPPHSIQGTRVADCTNVCPSNLSCAGQGPAPECRKDSSEYGATLYFSSKIQLVPRGLGKDRYIKIRTLWNNPALALFRVVRLNKSGRVRLECIFCYTFSF